MTASRLISTPWRRGTGQDLPPVQGLGTGHPTVCLGESADRLGSRCGRVPDHQAWPSLRMPAGNGALSVQASANRCRRKVHLRTPVRGPSAPLAKRSRDRQLALRGHSLQRHTHRANMRSTSSDDCRTGMSISVYAFSEAGPSSSLWFRCCETQLRHMSSNDHRGIMCWSRQAMPRPRASFI